MDLSKLGKGLKHPGVIVAGVVIGLLILFAVSRSKSAAGGSGGDYTLASQQVAAGTNVQLAGFTTDYNKAALAYSASMAQSAADKYATNVNANTAVTLQSLSTLDNLSRVAAQIGLVHEQNAGAVAMDAQRNDTLLKYQRASNDLSITLAPHLESLAQINAGADIARARISADSATTIAQLNAATARHVADTGYASSTTHDVITGLPGFLKMIGMGGGSSGSGSSGGDDGLMQAASTAASIFAFA